MPFVSVTDILFQSDEFWAHSTLESLQKLVKTCKGFKVTLQGESKKKKDLSLPSLTVQAMTVMMERRPAANNAWMLKFVDAMHCFRLRMDTIVNFCARLPAESAFYLSEADAEKARKEPQKTYICFVDAYQLALNTGLKAAMERRARSEQKLMNSAFESLDFRKPSDTMRKNIRAAMRDLRTQEQIPGVKKGLRLLTKLDQDIGLTWIDWSLIKDELRKQTRSLKQENRLRKCIANYNNARRTLTARYKAHSVYCPEKMPTEFLDA